jgi:hypothetical protein
MNKILLISIVIVILLIGFMMVKKDNKKENFSLPNFIQILPRYGNAPLLVSFVPIYVNEKFNYVIDFGDGKTKTSDASFDIYGFMHQYQNPGIYNGCIILMDSKNQPIRKQKFTINVK